jgi:SAM-dependent methyltransferase
LQAGDLVLDLGCGAGRHAFEAFRRGARVVALDYSAAELKDVKAMFGALLEEEAATLPSSTWGGCANGDATRLPFPDNSFDHVIAAEVLEHIPADEAAMAELARVLKPGGTIAVTVPAWLAERICWALTDEYHAPFVPGGHVRIYSEPELRSKLRGAGLAPNRAHHAHALHTPYWWLKCAVGPTNNDHPLVRAYHQVLLWDIGGRQPMARFTKLADRLANPVLGKSLVIYARKPE